jgi:hypothetical protein
MSCDILAAGEPCAWAQLCGVITEKYYAKWNKAQQDILDSDLARAWKN